MQPQPFITIVPDEDTGTPVFTGTTVPIKNFFDYVSAGDSMEKFLQDFPTVSEGQVHELLKAVDSMVASKTQDPDEKAPS